MQPIISVLVPNYNYARFLPHALDSVLNQKFANFEILVSDDGSSDESVGILECYAHRDPRIRIVLQERNLGMVANWNECLRLARGQYIKYVFADDALASPEALGRMLSLIESAPGVALVASARTLLDESSHSTEVWDELKNSGRYGGAELISRTLREDRNLIGEPSAVLFRREAAQRGFDARWNQLVDLEMWLFLLKSGDLVYTNEPLCAFRLHTCQQSVANRAANVGSLERLALYSRYQNYLSTGPAACPSDAAERRAIFRCVYYARRHAHRNAENRSLETELEAQLTRRWYFFYWCRHRLTKPFLNFFSFLRGSSIARTEPARPSTRKPKSSS